MNKDLLFAFAAGISFVVSLTVTLMLIGSYADKKACYAKWGDFRAEWGFWSGCMVEVNGVMVPEQVIRTIDDLE